MYANRVTHDKINRQSKSDVRSCERIFVMHSDFKTAWLTTTSVNPLTFSYDYAFELFFILIRFG